ncbi:STAS/SEC14 domain-containing protein [Rickettsiales bacterium LUAb2]
MFEIKNHEKYIHIKVSGKLSHNDYIEHLIPTIETAIKNYHKISLLIEATNFHGWEKKAFIDDVQLAIKHRKELNKVAIVGNKTWEIFLSKFFSIFVKADVKYFDISAINQAKQWLE